jgi:thioredoxin-like negative regulator of GroEL
VTRRPLLAALTTALACADRPPPAYTRVDGPAPALLGTRAAPTLVVFWATWCPPCREETDSLRALARAPVGDLELVTYGQDEGLNVVSEFFGGEIPRELNYTPDPDHAAAGAFGVDVLPAAFLVKDGRLVARFGGARDWNTKEMRRLLQRLLNEPGGEPPALHPPGG